MKVSHFSLLSLFLLLLSCNGTTEKVNNEIADYSDTPLSSNKIHNNDTIIKSKIHNTKFITEDIDGDSKNDSIYIVKGSNSQKYGLEIVLANGKKDYLGMGKNILGRGFDDIEWVGIFEKVPKGEVYWNNTDDEGEIIMPEDVKEENKIKLSHDAIFIHQAESCGGGIIYWESGKYHWIQQE